MDIVTSSKLFWPAAVDDLQLFPEEIAAILHYSRRAGKSWCTEAIATTASHCRMSVKKMRRIKKLLLAANIIEIQQMDGGVDRIRVKPIASWFKKEQIDEARQELRQTRNTTPLPKTTPPTKTTTPSQNGQGGTPQNGQGGTPQNDHPKDQPLRINQEGISPLPPEESERASTHERQSSTAQTAQRALTYLQQQQRSHQEYPSPSQRCNDRFTSPRPKLETPWEGNPRYEEFVQHGAKAMQISVQNFELMLVNARFREEQNAKATVLWSRFTKESGKTTEQLEQERQARVLAELNAMEAMS